MEKSLLEIIDDILLSAIVREVSLVRFVHDPTRRELCVWEKTGTGPFEIQEVLSERLSAAIISRLKIMAGMSISEHHTVQQGTYEFVLGTEFADAIKKLAIICIPTASVTGYGEEIIVILSAPKNN